MMELNSKLGRKAKRLIQQNYIAWLTTVDSRLTPQPRPVWFIWESGSFLIFSQPDAFKIRHLVQRARVSFNFNTDPTGDKDVLVFLGTAVFEPQAPRHTRYLHILRNTEVELRRSR